MPNFCSSWGASSSLPVPVATAGTGRDKRHCSHCAVIYGDITHKGGIFYFTCCPLNIFIVKESINLKGKQMIDSSKLWQYEKSWEISKEKPTEKCTKGKGVLMSCAGRPSKSVLAEAGFWGFRHTATNQAVGTLWKSCIPVEAHWDSRSSLSRWGFQIASSPRDPCPGAHPAPILYFGLKLYVSFRKIVWFNLKKSHSAGTNNSN